MGHYHAVESFGAVKICSPCRDQQHQLCGAKIGESCLCGCRLAKRYELGGRDAKKLGRGYLTSRKLLEPEAPQGPEEPTAPSAPAPSPGSSFLLAIRKNLALGEKSS